MAYGLGAYGLWGFFPLYWKLLHPSGALEILAHRIVWSVLVLGILVLLTHRQGQLRGILRDRRKTALLVIAATFVSINWGTYIYGVNHDRIVETALGYFINPLVTVGLGVVVLGERLRPLQWVSMGLALVAVLVLTFDYGHPPWIALTLAFSFGLYALVKKRASVQAIESLTFETSLVAPLAIGFLVYLAATGRSTFGAFGVDHALFMAGTGIATAVPLLLFGAAAIRLPLTVIGPLQYLAPIIQFSIGLVIFHEPMTHVRWIGFILVWMALVIFTVEAVSHYRRVRVG